MIVAIYSRKSTEQDATEENRSVARQEALCRAVAAGRGWPVEHVYVDDWVSGAEFERRPELVRLLNNLKPRPSFGALLVYDKDRIGREQFETAYILKQLSVAGITIVECKGGVGREIALDTPMDKFLLAATSFAAELERDKARQRTADALLTKARAGHVTGGRLFGYDNVDVRSAEGHRERVERRINETEAQVVRSIFERYASGAGLRAIAHALNAEGAPAPKPRRNGRLKGWAPSSVREALHRETYIAARSSTIGPGSATAGAGSTRSAGRRPRSSGSTPRPSGSSPRSFGRASTSAWEASALSTLNQRTASSSGARQAASSRSSS